jgi:hypothetical protein
MITIGYSTRVSNPKFQDYLKKSCGLHKCEVIEVVNNGEKSLSIVYNEILSKSKNNIVVLCHDDIYFEGKNWGKKIISHFESSDYGILGVAGTTDIPENGMWWGDRTKMVGIVNHENDGKKWESKYSNGFFNEVLQVCLIDGLFISINKEKIKKNFNEEVDGFHFYDVTFCVENYLSDVKIGVIYDVRLTHKSIGMTNEKWEKNRLIFVEKFKSNLPIKLSPNINYNLISYDPSKEKYPLVIQTSDEISNVENIFTQLKNLSIFENLNISLISNERNIEYLKKFEGNNVKVYEGFFDTLNKNLSILKWDETFLEDKKDLIFFSNDKLDVLNNVFSSIVNIYKKEKNIFGCAFPSALNPDKTIFSNGLDIIQNQEQKIQLLLRYQFTYYNIFQGYYQHPFGNISDFFATTLNNLKKLDWFDINFDTNIFFLTFAVKLQLSNLKIFIDTNSLISQNFSENQEKVNEELRQIIGQIVQNDKLKGYIKLLK